MAETTETVELKDWIEVPRYAWHTPPWDYDTSKGIQSYQPGRTAEMSGEARAIRSAFPSGQVTAKGIIWLAPEYPGAEWAWNSYSRKGGIRIDLSKLDMDKLRYTYQSEGYLWHLGDIPKDAFCSE